MCGCFSTSGSRVSVIPVSFQSRCIEMQIDENQSESELAIEWFAVQLKMNNKMDDDTRCAEIDKINRHKKAELSQCCDVHYNSSLAKIVIKNQRYFSFVFKNHVVVDGFKIHISIRNILVKYLQEVSRVHKIRVTDTAKFDFHLEYLQLRFADIAVDVNASKKKEVEVHTARAIVVLLGLFVNSAFTKICSNCW